MKKRQGINPQFIFATGDLINGNRVEKKQPPSFERATEKNYTEYKNAFDWLESLQSKLKENNFNTKLFVVPGNHDVNHGELLNDITDPLDELIRPGSNSQVVTKYIRLNFEMLFLIHPIIIADAKSCGHFKYFKNLQQKKG